MAGLEYHQIIHHTSLERKFDLKKKTWLLHQNEYLRPFIYPCISNGAGRGEGRGVHQNDGPFINDFKQTVYRIPIKVPSVTKNSKNQMLWHFRLQLQNPKQLILFFAHLQLRHLLLLHWQTAANVTSLSKQSIVFHLNFKFPPWILHSHDSFCGGASCNNVFPHTRPDW